ncbi:MAG TPA: hypothetical protein VN843_28160, partial [Anaerolineales bacterium]|nr:hypothetical protein [Anaerolineales bacterium]
MSENIRTTPLRLRPSEHRTILFVGDLITAIASVFAALFTWRQYNLYVFQNLYAQYLADDLIPREARRLAESQT